MSIAMGRTSQPEAEARVVVVVVVVADVCYWASVRESIPELPTSSWPGPGSSRSLKARALVMAATVPDRLPKICCRAARTRQS